MYGAATLTKAALRQHFSESKAISLLELAHTSQGDYMGVGPSLGWVAAGAAGAAAMFGGFLLLQKTCSPAAGNCDESAEGWRPEKAADSRPASQYGCGVVAAMLIAVPSVMGAWCWPVVLMALIGASADASGQSRAVSHHMSLGANVVILGGIIYHVAVTTAARRRGGSSAESWWPTVLVAVGSGFMMWDVLRHVMLDHGGLLFSERTLMMYNEEGTGLSAMGWTSMLLAIVGMCMLMVGMMLFLKVPEKLTAAAPSYGAVA